MLFTHTINRRNIRQSYSKGVMITELKCEVCERFRTLPDLVLIEIDGPTPIDHAVLCKEKCSEMVEMQDKTPRRLWLDDERAAPDSTWMVARTVAEARTLMKEHPFHELSLDHDLGQEVHGTGYDFLVWLERVAAGMEFVPAWFKIPPIIKLHTQNPVGRENMLRVIESIRRLEGETRP